MDKSVIKVINELLPTMSEKEKCAFYLAFGAHTAGDQRDQVGLEYILHPLTVFMHCDTEETRIVALLHDVAEDTKITLEDISLFFNEQIVEAIRLLSHPKVYDKEEYFRKIKENPIARKVKIEDLKTNTDISRLDSLKEWLEHKIESSYIPALNYLEND